MRYVYIMRNSRYQFRYKIGISNNVNFRRMSIDNSMKGSVHVIFSARFFYAENVETLMHQIYRPLRAKMTGSGKTEWFWFILPITPILILSGLWVLQWFIILFVPATIFYFITDIRNGTYKNQRISTEKRADRASVRGIVSPALRNDGGKCGTTTQPE